MQKIILPNGYLMDNDSDLPLADPPTPLISIVYFVHMKAEHLY
jgi:hypothetical protein